MTHEIIMAGFGGQGVMTIGKILAAAALKEGKNVVWLPSYGPEMRGGTANCNVTISDKEISNPFVSSATAVLALNQPSLDKFEKYLLPGGILVINSSLTSKNPSRNDVKIYNIPANDIASELGNVKIANMVMLGTYLQITGIVKVQMVINVITELIGSKKPEIMALNKKAIMRGADCVK